MVIATSARLGTVRCFDTTVHAQLPGMDRRPVQAICRRLRRWARCATH